MPPRTQLGSADLGAAIRQRRVDLGLSIEEAAARAGIGTKTFSRYESGSAIRSDKIRGLCKAMGWRQLPTEPHDTESAEPYGTPPVDESHEAWSDALEKRFGRPCALVFAVGSDLLMDHASDDLRELASEPRGTHLGQLDTSWLNGSLPSQFVPRYEYEFVYELKSTIKTLRERFVYGTLIAHTVLEEIALYLIFAEAELVADIYPDAVDNDDEWTDWVEDILGDFDVGFYLFGRGEAVTPRVVYHFDHWLEPQFYMNGEQLSGVERSAARLGLLHESVADNESLTDEEPEPAD